MLQNGCIGYNRPTFDMLLKLQIHRMDMVRVCLLFGDRKYFAYSRVKILITEVSTLIQRAANCQEELN